MSVYALYYNGVLQGKISCNRGFQKQDDFRYNGTDCVVSDVVPDVVTGDALGVAKVYLVDKPTQAVAKMDTRHKRRGGYRKVVNEY